MGVFRPAFRPPQRINVASISGARHAVPTFNVARELLRRRRQIAKALVREPFVPSAPAAAGVGTVLVGQPPLVVAKALQPAAQLFVVAGPAAPPAPPGAPFHVRSPRLYRAIPFFRGRILVLQTAAPAFGTGDEVVSVWEWQGSPHLFERGDALMMVAQLGNIIPPFLEDIQLRVNIELIIED